MQRIGKTVIRTDSPRGDGTGKIRLAKKSTAPSFLIACNAFLESRWETSPKTAAEETKRRLNGGKVNGEIKLKIHRNKLKKKLI